MAGKSDEKSAIVIWNRFLGGHIIKIQDLLLYFPEASLLGP